MQGVLLLGGKNQHSCVTADLKGIYSHSAGGTGSEAMDKNISNNKLQRRVLIELPDMSKLGFECIILMQTFVPQGVYIRMVEKDYELSFVQEYEYSEIECFL